MLTQCNTMTQKHDKLQSNTNNKSQFDPNS